MGLFSIWGNKTDIVLYPMPRPFELQMLFDEFVNKKCQNIYIGILQECYRRSIGLDEKQANSLWDNFTGAYSNATRGVIRLIAAAMAQRTTCYLTYDKSTGIARQAIGEEQAQIMQDYQKYARSDKGVICNFNRFDQTLLIKLYLGMLYGTLEASNTQVGLSKALKFKAKDLRVTQSNVSHDEWISQGKAVVEGLKHGKPVLIDKEDDIELTKIDTDPTKEAISMYSQLMAGELGVSASYITGILTAGMNSTGEAEIEKTEGGIENFFNSIFKPICDALYNVNLKYQTSNYRKMSELTKILPYLETSEYVKPEQIQSFVNKIFGDNE